MESAGNPTLHDPTFLKHLAIAALIILIAGVVYWLLKRACVALETKKGVPQPITSLMVGIAKFGILVATVFLILEEFGIPLEKLFAFLAAVAAMVAIGFVAVWSILSNFFSTFIIKAFRPFSVGDEIEFPGETIKGKVLSIGFYYTTVSDTDGSMYKIPNNTFFQKVLKQKPSR